VQKEPRDVHVLDAMGRINGSIDLPGAPERTPHEGDT
jgi:hypothetical protein